MDDIDLFLEHAGWGKAVRTPFPGDGAARRYFRVTDPQAGSAVLMQTIPGPDGSETPGHHQADFVRIAQHLARSGISVPRILNWDRDRKILLLEDFGVETFSARLARLGEAERPILYGLAVDVLDALSRVPVETIALPDYYDSHVHKGLRRVIDWYAPYALNRPVGAEMVESYLTAWADIERSLPPAPRAFLHIDFHLGNLMYLPERQGVARCGVLDFQGAMRGPAPYDLVNLLEDARQDIPEDLRTRLLDRFCVDMMASQSQDFRLWYRVLGTQFHCRVIGQFIRLALVMGKTGYLEHLPRLERYITRALNEPVLNPLRDWFHAHGLAFDVAAVRPVDIDALRLLIGPGAF